MQENIRLRASMIFQGSNPGAAIVGQDELPGKSNYFRGSDESTWHTNIANFRKVQYKDVYPGINLVITEINGSSSMTS